MLRTFESLKDITLSKKSECVWFKKIDNEVKVGLCVMTSKDYSKEEDYFTKYYPLNRWFTLIKGQKNFLDTSQESYVFLGFLDNDPSAYLIPYNPYKKHFKDCIEGKGKNEKSHIKINHRLGWYHRKDEILIRDLSKFNVPLK